MTNDQEQTKTYCYRHPAVETGLRCNKCGRYICSKCAVRTPVGYTCRECIRKQEDKFYTGAWTDYIIAVVIALPLSLIATLIFTFVIGLIGWFSWIISFFAAPITGGIIAEAVRRGVRKRRSRYLAHTVAACLIVSVAPIIIIYLLGGAFMALIVPGILIFMGTGTIMARLR
jgi:hypothetical protein